MSRQEKQSVFEKYLIWFWVTLLISSFPILMRLHFYFTSNGGIDAFDLKDLVFGGLGLNLANYNIIGYRKGKRYDTLKTVIYVFSTILSCYFSFAISTIFAIESSKNSNSGITFFYVIIIVTTLLSLLLSYWANRLAALINSTK